MNHPGGDRLHGQQDSWGNEGIIPDAGHAANIDQPEAF